MKPADVTFTSIMIPLDADQRKLIRSKFKILPKMHLINIIIHSLHRFRHQAQNAGVTHYGPTLKLSQQSNSRYFSVIRWCSIPVMFVATEWKWYVSIQQEYTILQLFGQCHVRFTNERITTLCKSDITRSVLRESVYCNAYAYARAGISSPWWISV